MKGNTTRFVQASLILGALLISGCSSHTQVVQQTTTATPQAKRALLERATYFEVVLHDKINPYDLKDDSRAELLHKLYQPDNGLARYFANQFSQSFAKRLDIEPATTQTKPLRIEIIVDAVRFYPRNTYDYAENGLEFSLDYQILIVDVEEPHMIWCKPRNTSEYIQVKGQTRASLEAMGEQPLRRLGDKLVKQLVSQAINRLETELLSRKEVP